MDSHIKSKIDTDSLKLQITQPYQADKSVKIRSLEERVVLLILRDLIRLNWKVYYLDNHIEIIPPKNYDKDTIRTSMAIKREEIIKEKKDWIDNHIEMARANLANGYDVLESKIQPFIEVCKTRRQHALFRIFRHYWSSPYSEYVGRRIKLFIRDKALPRNPVIGIAALGSPIIHIPERDEWIGWDKDMRTKNLNYTMDAYVIGALPPYNYLLGGKLVSYILTSKEIRDIFSKKYNYSKYNKLAGFFTTGLYGNSSQYNRMKSRYRLLYQPIGETKGYGTLHLTNETFNAMNDFLKDRGVIVSNKFGAGPCWSMRLIRSAAELLGFDADMLLRHSFKRKIYFIALAKNTISFLNGKSKKLNYYNSKLNTLTNYWRHRWLKQRLKNERVLDKIKWFHRDSFEL